MEPIHTEASGQLFHGDAVEFFANVTEAQLAAMVVICDQPYGAGKYSTDVALPDKLIARIVATAKCSAFFHWPEDLVAMCVRLRVTPVEWVTWWSPKCEPRANNLREDESMRLPFGGGGIRQRRLRVLRGGRWRVRVGGTP